MLTRLYETQALAVNKKISRDFEGPFENQRQYLPAVKRWAKIVSTRMCMPALQCPDFFKKG